MNKRLFWSVLMVLFYNIAFAQYDNTAAEQQGLKLTAQAWTFNKFTFIEAIDKMKAAGINNIEMFPSQIIGGGIEGETSFLMDKNTRKNLLELIKSKKMRLVNYGVISLNTKEEWIQLMEFAKDMGIETIISEADSMQLNFIEPLCEKYKIRVALHNHPQSAKYNLTSLYWNPDFTMQQIAHRNKYIGLCPDLGHWLRSGLNSLESLKKYEGRIFNVHAKDLIPGEGGLGGYHDVPWGTGLNNFSGLIHELKRQNYNGTITVEYEYNWLNSFDEIKESVQYFNRLTYWMSKEK